MVSGGCIVSGSTVRHSLLFSSVRVHSYCSIEEAVILPNVEIGRGAMLTRVVVDKGTRIPAGPARGVDPEEDRKRFHVTDKGITLITPDMLGQQLHHLRLSRGPTPCTMLTEHDIYLFREGTHAALLPQAGLPPATATASGGAHFAVWAPNARAVSRHRRLERLAAGRRRAARRAGTARASGKRHVAGVEHGQAYKYRIVGAATARAREGRSVRVLRRARRRPRLRARGRSSTTGTTRSGWRERAQRTTRSTRRCSIYEVHLGSWRARARRRRCPATARSRSRSRDYCAAHRLHARRADADHRASVLRLVGLPDHRLLRADRALRHAAGLHAPRRRACTATASA